VACTCRYDHLSELLPTTPLHRFSIKKHLSVWEVTTKTEIESDECHH
jgi:hypothetical protein